MVLSSHKPLVTHLIHRKISNIFTVDHRWDTDHDMIEGGGGEDSAPRLHGRVRSDKEISVLHPVAIRDSVCSRTRRGDGSVFFPPNAQVPRVAMRYALCNFDWKQAGRPPDHNSDCTEALWLTRWTLPHYSAFIAVDLGSRCRSLAKKSQKGHLFSVRFKTRPSSGGWIDQPNSGFPPPFADLH